MINTSNRLWVIVYLARLLSLVFMTLGLRESGLELLMRSSLTSVGELM